MEKTYAIDATTKKEFTAFPEDTNIKPLHFDTVDELEEWENDNDLEKSLSYKVVCESEGERPFFEALQVTSKTFKAYYYELHNEINDDTTKAAIAFLYHQGGNKDFSGCYRKAKDVTIYSQGFHAVACQEFDDLCLHDIPEQYRHFLDYDAIAEEYSANYSSIDYDGIEYTITSY